VARVLRPAFLLRELGAERDFATISDRSGSADERLPLFA